MGNKKVTTDDFIKRAKERHGNKYDYSKTEYNGTHSKVIIICPIHFEFNQSPNNHLRSSGCLKCADRKQAMSTDDFLIKANEVHNNKYMYSKTKYYNNETNVIVTCLIHGDFKQKPKNHLNGRGCSKCSSMYNGGYSRTNYIDKARDRLCTFYIIRCFNNSEEFYKIGITVNSIRKRYRTLKEMPYSYDVVSEIYGEAGSIWDLELKNKRSLKEYHYLPNIKFDGSLTECFTKYKNNVKTA